MTVSWWLVAGVWWRVCFINNVKWPAFLFWRVFTVIMIISMLLSFAILESSRAERCQLGRAGRKKQVGRARHMDILWWHFYSDWMHKWKYLEISRGAGAVGQTSYEILTNFGVACQVFIKTGARVWERGRERERYCDCDWSRYQDSASGLELSFSSVWPPALTCQSLIFSENTRHSTSYWIQTTKLNTIFWLEVSEAQIRNNKCNLLIFLWYDKNDFI